MKHSYKIEGIHCQNCVQKISTAIKGIEGIKEVSVSVNPPKAVIDMDKHISLETLNEAVKSAGEYTLKEEDIKASEIAPVDTSQSLRPLFIIAGYLIGGVLLRAFISGNFHLHALMENFMGGFFVLFSLFKLIDLSGFADGYSTYDIIAKRSRAYALTYPFIELSLSIAYLASQQLFFVNIITILLMSVSSIGVFQALSKKQTIQCACLGTALKLPMTKVTLIEDLLMVFMAVIMLFI